MPNKRSRADIHAGDRVRMEHTLDYGTVVSENNDLITVKMDKESGNLTLLKALFVPVIDKKSADGPKS